MHPFLPKYISLRLSVWISLLSIILVDALILTAKDIQFELGDWSSVVSCSIQCIIVAVMLRYLSYILIQKLSSPLIGRICITISILLELLALWFLFVMVQVVFSYLGIACFKLPYQDSLLLAFDKMVGFNWDNYINWAEHNDIVRKVFIFSYNSPWTQTPLVFLLLAITQQYSRAYGLLLAFIISALVCVIVAIICPSTGIITFLHINGSQFLNLHPDTGMGGVQQGYDLEQLRSESYHQMIFGKLTGIIGFPSYHTIYACLLGWAFWSIRWLRWPMAILNALVVISTPAAGGHYLADTLAGIIIAFFIMQIINSLIERESKIKS